jgi:ubiquinone/menaquinone biosynthesis C-methylase UbiE
MSVTPADGAPAPNHHADHPDFAGIGGTLAAISFSIGRTADADLAIELTETDVGDDVVDIGCGPGVAVRRAAAHGASSVVGIDPAAVMLRVALPLTRARHGTAPMVRFLDGSAEDLPLPDDSASVIWSLATVHHWNDLDAGLAEVRRVLRPEGRFLAIERQVASGASGHASHGWTEDQAQLFAQVCRTAGFEDVSVDRHDDRRRRVLSVLAR